MIWGRNCSREPFQKILDRRIESFSYDDCHLVKKSGMTAHQEWMLSVGIRFNFPEKRPGRRFYDASTRGWDPVCTWEQFKADALLVPDELYIKTVFLGYLP